MSDTKIPDAITPVVGYRAFTVMMGKLWSPMGLYRVAWPKEGPLRARCLRHLEQSILARAACAVENHEAPDPDCSCGIHAMWEPWDIPRLSVPQPWDLVVGRVHGWGRVVLGEIGWRAAFVRPVELYSSPAWTEPTRFEMERVAKMYLLPFAGSAPRERLDEAAA